MPTIFYNKTASKVHPLDFIETALTSAENGNLDEFVFIVSTERLKRKLEKEITLRHLKLTSLPLEKLNIHTFDSFITKFYNSFQEKKKLISSSISFMLFEEAFQNAKPEYFARKNKSASLGVIERVNRVIIGIRNDGIIPTDFDNDIKLAKQGERGFDASKLKDLKNIYTEYLKLLNPLWIDYQGQLNEVNKRLTINPIKTFTDCFPKIKNIVIHGLNEISQPQLELLNKLSEITNINVQIQIDYAEENGPLYGNFVEMIENLTKNIKFISYDSDPLQEGINETDRNPYIHHIRKNLFRTKSTIENSNFDEMIRVFGFENIDDELKGIASLVKSLHIDDGIELNKICIAVTDSKIYTENLREELAENGIPIVISNHNLLNQNGLVTSIFSAINIPVNNFDKRDVIRAVTSPYLDFGDNVDAFNLVSIADELRISRDENFWKLRITQKIEFLKNRIRIDSDTEYVKQCEQDIYKLETSFKSIDSISKLFKKFKPKLTPEEFRNSVLEIISTLKITKNILSLKHSLDENNKYSLIRQRTHDEVEGDMKALTSFVNLLNEITEHFKIRFADYSTQDSKRSLEFYLDRLKIGSVLSTYSLREKSDFGVNVLPIEELSGLEFDIVICAGVSDGYLPTVYIPENFLGKPLKSSRERNLRKERILFYNGITRFKKKLFITNHRLTNRGERKIESTFLRSLLNIVTLEKSNYVFEIEKLSSVRNKIRNGEIDNNELSFLKYVSSKSQLSEELGALIWNSNSQKQILDTKEFIDKIVVDKNLVENLYHNIYVEKLRETNQNQPIETKQLSQFEGILDKGFNQADRKDFNNKLSTKYSITQLEEYAKCPFRYFSNRILGIKNTMKYDVTLTPLERGQLLHTIMFKLYTELRDLKMLPIIIENFDKVLSKAKEIANQQIEGITIDHPYWIIDKERLLGSELIMGTLKRWIEYDMMLNKGGKKLVPQFFEVNFGDEKNYGEGDKLLIDLADFKIGVWKLKGKIDRIEIYRVNDEIYFLIADYKTGTPPNKNEIYNGTSLQLMIYIEAVRSLLSKHYNLQIENIKPLGGIYYQMTKGKKIINEYQIMIPVDYKEEMLGKGNRQGKEIKTINDLEDIVNQTIEFTKGYLNGIENAEFNLTDNPTEKICGNCPYQYSCRISV